ncbi:MAG: T9SS type A sorting domain-containing protein [Haliscomenobacter sp.]|nr:T9SS type A sorting domain-containing protein [Haliscomenobacter sp.]MBK7474988.1 T9SS type A sorting domain-containing protein [Haliscomenobacter sp.]MBK8880435.1 T9SS type A sorting domain-containing protein [Haliscomenobacter sp.]
MKQHLLFAILCFLTTLTHGQVLKVEPSEVKQTFKVSLADPFLDLELHATIRNTSATDTFRLKWLRKELNKPEGWLSQVCDGVECFVPIVSSNIDPMLGLSTPFVLPPNSKADFIFHVLPGQVAGSANYSIQFSSVAKPDSILASMRFDVVVQSLVTNLKDLRQDGIQVYPNPASDFFEISASEGVDKIVVYNALGVPVKTFLSAPGQRYSLGRIPDGIYLIALINNQKGVLKTTRLFKRGIRS